LPRRFSASAALLAAIALGACSTAGGEAAGDATLRVYVSLPLSGSGAAEGQDAADGAELALAEAGGEAGGVAVEAVVLDDAEGDRWSPVEAAANAREAISDSTAIAYLGELESGATRASLPITSEARLLQVSPGSSAEDLIAPFVGSDELPQVQSVAGRSFGRVIPGDSVQGEAAAVWAKELGWRRVSIARDGSDFGSVLADAFEDRAQELGIEVSRGEGAPRTFLAGDGEAPAALGSDVLLPPYSPVSGSAADFATSAALDPSHLPAAGQDFLRRFEAEYGRAAGRYAAYGYESMAVVLDAIERATDPADRSAVIEAFFDTPERDTVLGSSAIDELGETTLERISGYELDGKRLSPGIELDAGR